MNVKPLGYSWPEFYDHVIDLTKYTFSWRSIGRRLKYTKERIPRWMNFVRAVSSEGFGRIKYHSEIRRRLDHDKELRAFFEGESTKVPQFYLDRMKNDLGPLWDHLPEGAINHDPNAYLKEESLVQLAAPGKARSA